MAAALGDKRGPEKRGPRLGDAASLWNFTAAPGWTKEEAQILKLCLMRHGVGRWVQILDTGLLPGKMIQQLNGQTQRLLGQQSLAAYTGLQVDVDRIRADNERLAGAERKNGLVINSGPNLTKQQKQQMQEEAKAKYGLSELELQEVEEQLQELAAARQPQPGAAAAAAAAAGAARDRAQRDAELLGRDTSGMSHEQKLDFLLQLHERLQQAAARLATAHAAAGAGTLQPAAAAAAMAAAAAAGGAVAGLGIRPAGSSENEGAVANPMQLDAPAAAAAPLPPTWVLAASKPPAAGKAAGGKRKAGGKRAAQRASSDTSSEEDDWKPEPRAGSGRSRRGTAAMDVDGPTGGGAAAAAAAVAADVEQLVGMGFSAKQARDALEESGHDLEAAIEWLVAHCI